MVAEPRGEPLTLPGAPRLRASLFAFAILVGLAVVAAALASLRPALLVTPAGTVEAIPRLETLRLHLRDSAVWLPFLPAVIALTAGASRARAPLALAAHAGAAMACVTGYALLSGYWLNTLDRGLAWHMTRDASRVILLYGATVGCWYAMLTAGAAQRQALRTRTLEAQLMQARLNALQMQLQPHFVFNTLHGIGSMIDTHPREAQRMVTLLGELLRTALDRSAVATVPLRDEIAWIERYLALQRMRFGERLQVRIEMPEDAADAALPSLLLQPLVENAITHGSDPETGAASVRLSARHEDGRVHITIADSSGARRAAGGSTPGRGLGLSNTRARLDALYGSAARMTLRETPEGTELVLDLPFGDGAQGMDATDA